jgi:hypothetical protein
MRRPPAAQPAQPAQPASRHRAGAIAVATAGVLAAATISGCAAARDAAPRCGDAQRLAIVAQSMPGASYLPCLNELPQGWSASAFNPTQSGTSFVLTSDRAPQQPVRVNLVPGCDVAGASPTPSRADGVLTYTRVTSISPRYAGTLYDVFPGGCVAYHFGFNWGQQIELMDQFKSAIGLYPRQQLRLDLRKKLGVELDP